MAWALSWRLRGVRRRPGLGGASQNACVLVEPGFLRPSRRHEWKRPFSGASVVCSQEGGIAAVSPWGDPSVPAGPPRAASQNSCVLVEPGFYIPPVATNGNAPSLGRRWCAIRRAGLRPSRLRAIRPSLRDRRKRRPRTHAFWSNPGSASLPPPQTQTPLLRGVSFVAEREGLCRSRLRAIPPSRDVVSGPPQAASQNACILVEPSRVLIPPRATNTNAPLQGRFCLWRRGRDSNPR